MATSINKTKVYKAINTVKPLAKPETYTKEVSTFVNSVKKHVDAPSMSPIQDDGTKKSKITKIVKKSNEDVIENENSADSEEEDKKEPVIDILMTLSGASKEDVLQEFVELIYENTHCVGGKIKDVLYKELPNTWSQRKNFTEEEKKYECGGEAYDDCTVSSKINKPVKGNVKLIWKFNKTKADGVTVNLNVDKEWKALNKPKVLGFMKKSHEHRKEVFLQGQVQINSNSHDSEDHRGSNHCLIDLPVNKSVTLTNPTLEQFIEAFWMIKFKKFDKWYELYVGSKISSKKNMIVIDCSFDNGS